MILSATTTRLSGEVFSEILKLHVPPNALIADVTWGRGVFWSNVIDWYRIVGSDLNGNGSVKADFRSLPYRDNIFDCAVLDPPWANLSSRPRGIMSENYGLKPTTPSDLRQLYYDGMSECSRILRPGGILVVKCQDMVSSGRKHWFSVDVFLAAIALEFVILDRKLQINPTPPHVRSPYRQQHFRVNESTYWVLKKKEKRS